MLVYYGKKTKIFFKYEMKSTKQLSLFTHGHEFPTYRQWHQENNRERLLFGEEPRKDNTETRGLYLELLKKGFFEKR